MNIFLIIPSLGSGGAERVGVLLANGLSARDHNIVVFSNLAHSKDYQLQDGINIVDIGVNGKGRISKWVYAVRVVRRKIKAERPDVIIGIMSIFSLIGYIASMGWKVPVIATMHNSFERPNYELMSVREKFLKYVVNRIYKKVTILTKSDQLFIGKRLTNTMVMPNPLALEPIEELCKRNNIILAAGRLDDWHYKGFDILIKSFAKLLNGSKVAEPRSKFKSNDIAFKIREEGWKLQIAGAGSKKSLNYLKQLCKENGVEDSVEFLGFRKDVEKLYQDASIFVLSSRYEGFGLVLIEAMSQGCACVACDYKGRQREIIAPLEKSEQSSKFFLRDATKASQRAERNVQSSNCRFEACDNGILCEPDNVDSLAAGIQKMIGDNEYRESIRAKAVERSKYYSIENTVDRWELLLEQIKN